MHKSMSLQLYSIDNIKIFKGIETFNCNLNDVVYKQARVEVIQELERVANKLILSTDNAAK